MRIFALVAALFLICGWSLQDTPRAQIERDIGNIRRDFWVNNTVTGGAPTLHPAPFPQNTNSPTGTIWDMAAVLDVEYEWWVVTGRGDAEAARRIAAYWLWITNSYNPDNIQGCGSVRTGGSASSGYWYITGKAQDDAAWTVKTLLQIYDVTSDPLALTYAIGLDACISTQWAAGNGGIYYQDAHDKKSISQAQWMLDAYTIYQMNGDTAQLAIAETENTFIQTYMLRPDNMYSQTIAPDNTRTTSQRSDPPSVTGPTVCLHGNTIMAVFLAREYIRTKTTSYLTTLTNLVTAMVASTGGETLTSLSGTKVWMNDCDSTLGGTRIVEFAREVVPLLGSSLQAQVKQIFQDTANSIRVNAYNPAVPGNYGANWEGPFAGSWAVAQPETGTPDFVAEPVQAVLMLIANYVVQIPHNPITVAFGTTGLPLDNDPTFYSRPDAYNLFDSSSQWPIGTSKTNIIHISDLWVFRATVPHRQALVDFANSHSMKIAMHAAGVNARSDCGHGLESNNYSPASYTVNLNLIKARGGTVDYIALDEPVTFGHEPWPATVNNLIGCEFTPVELAGMAAVLLQASQAVFPNIRVISTEAVSSIFNTAEYTQAIQQWIPAFAAAAGQPFAYFVMDINQSNLAPDQIVSIASVVKASGVKLGYFIDGNKVGITTSAAWIKDAVSFYRYLEGTLLIQPDLVFPASWFQNPDPIPVNFLPESSPDTVTNVLMQYILDHPG